ncbi:MAG: phosphatidate cytidylyltransferase [Lewinellaceae bacterium]|nr:phosphatidate cytidylyltransferase [Lewinellaceae bacterium]
MRQRTITAFFFAAVMMGGIYGGSNAFKILFTIIVVGSLWELFAMLLLQDEPHKIGRKIWGTLVATLPFLLVFWSNSLNRPGMIYLLVLLVFASLAAELFLRSKTPFQNVAVYALGFVYVCFPFIFLNWIAYASSPTDYAPNRVLGLLLLVWTNDTGAYLTGKQFGKHKLLERISPKKTWEGTLGGAVFTVLIAWGLSFLIKDFTLPQWLALSLVAAIGSNIGDLVESMLKRSVGVKDSGSFMPGHGGFLDRFDAFIFCLPFFWLVLQLV